MNFHLPTFDECMDIVNRNEAFTHKVETVDGHTFHMFNYRLANWEDFMKYPGALEMRGLTFRGPLPGGVYERHLHMHKFFNLNQGGQGEEEKYADEEIVRVQNKEDGSLIIPVVVNGKIYCKTRGTFGSIMAQEANKIIAADKRLRDFIIEADFAGDVTFFEYVSPWNQIVLRYPKTELRLLQLRRKKTGEYMNWNENTVNIWKEQWGIKHTQTLESEGLDYWVAHAESKIDIEGWVLTFANGHMVKIKTEWYKHLHHLLTENLTRENELIKLVVKEELDDVLSNVPTDDPRRFYALDISVFLRKLLNEWTEEIRQKIWELKPNKPNSRKTFAIANKEHRLFGVMMKCFTDHEDGNYDDEKLFDMVGEYVVKSTDKWGKAQEFLKRLGFQSEYQPPTMEE